ncbi:MAG TPA: hypothetical protein VKE49_11305 [Myxococcaceae bacterium]|nr:hypothetical protein [Myxococcaceae bacterium]
MSRRRLTQVAKTLTTAWAKPQLFDLAHHPLPRAYMARCGNSRQAPRSLRTLSPEARGTLGTRAAELDADPHPHFRSEPALAAL